MSDVSSPGASGPPPWVIVASGFHQGGGMERANAALAEYLLESGIPVHLVGHDIDEALRKHPLATSHVIARPAGSFYIGARGLDREGRAVAEEVSRSRRDARVVVNGGNCHWSDINWVHAVHHAWPSSDRRAPLWFKAKNRLARAAARRDEKEVIPGSRLVIANSERTRADLERLLEVDGERIRRIYLGSDPKWGEVTAAERRVTRNGLGIDDTRPVVAFVGALGYDDNKGIDLLLQVWSRLRRDPSWSGLLMAVGGGRGLSQWERMAQQLCLGDSVRFTGFTDRVSELLAGADLLVSPSRYDAYGLNVQEAVCRGIPALVSSRAGISERYPSTLREMVLPDPEDLSDLEARLRSWNVSSAEWRARFQPLADELRAHSWRDMAREIVEAGTSETPTLK